MKKNQWFKFAFLCIMLAMALTVGFAVSSKKAAKADGIFDWFKRVSIKKCAISLEQSYYDWTGKPITPEVKVNYMGTDLVKNVDYVVSYQYNVDAGTGIVIVEGKGNYKSSASVEFEIIGVDFENECNVELNNGVIKVYYQGELLRKDKDYGISISTRSRLIETIPAGTKCVNVYEIITYYKVYGKGKYGGSVTKTSSYIERRIEDAE